MKVKILISALLLLIAGLIYIEFRNDPPTTEGFMVVQELDVEDPQSGKAQHSQPDLPKASLMPAVPQGAARNERSLSFKDQEALEAFLKRAGDSVAVVGRIDALNSLRIRISDFDAYQSALGDDAEEGYVFPVSIPTVENGSVQPGAVPLGNQLLNWLGITEDNSDWGKGVKVAVLDSGVTSNFTFDSATKEIVLVPYSSNPADLNGHGTAVASTIKGSHAMAPGVAPGVDLISVRISNDAGQSDSFLLADGIVKATDAGAELINISMGGFGDSQIVRNAVDYAMSKGALVIAAVGNNGINQVYYPAAMNSVIGVGAVDAMGNHLDFSNYGPQVSVAAPGYQVNAAWTNNQVTQVSGTSFSAPIITGSIAAVMTQASGSKLAPRQAWDLMQNYLNDGGSAGTDSQLGAGMPDLGRIMNRNTPGYYDAAIASMSLLPPDSGNPYGKVEILVQNRGNEPLINTVVSVKSPTGESLVNLTSMQPGGVQSVQVPVTQALIGGAGTFNLRTQVKVADGITDNKMQNNQRNVTYVPLSK